MLHLPVFFMNGNLLNGTGDVKSNLERLISASLAGPKQEGEILGVDLASRFKDIRPLAVVGAGLADGINPCAFTVIVFFMSYLAFQGYRKLELLIIGLSFITAVFLTYFLIGLGIFNFLYRLEGFWVFTRIFNVSVGIFSLVLGVLAVYDLLKFSRTRDIEGQLLQLPQVIKNRIHSVIGRHYRKVKEEGAQKGPALNPARLVLSALITGFLVSILEAVCTGQLYLPTLAFILKSTPLKAKALGYLVIYNVMFVIPLFIIFLLALLGVTSSAFAQFIRKHLVSVKALMAIIFISLGIFLVWRG
jgi:cytochrome c biogenesis protein CcdA